MDLYGRMVSAGHWRDYSMDFQQGRRHFLRFAVRRRGQNTDRENPRCATGRACGH